MSDTQAQPKYGMIGRSPAMLEVYERIRKIAPLNCTVLIVGETGTGKEIVARSIYENSGRRNYPFLAVNCGALTETLLHSELFGHLKGAFTDAYKGKDGLFAVATNGTLFLDEITETSMKTQAALLRVLQFGKFYQVGGTKELSTDARVIAAASRSLECAVQRGEFMAALRYRIEIAPIYLPPLRGRGSDIKLLANHFLKRYNQKYGRNVSFTPDSAEFLLSQRWEGNVRELESLVERAIIYSDDGQEVLDTQFLERIKRVPVASDDEPQEQTNTGLKTMREIEKEEIKKRLKYFGGNIAATARTLGRTRPNLHAKLKKMGISVERPKE